MEFKLISSATKLRNKVALVRLDVNVPIKSKKVEDDTRLRESIPTLRFLERRGAKIIIIGHLGRPEGKKVASLSLKPIGYALGKLLRQPVQVLPLELGIKNIRQTAQKGMVILENIRFYKGEDKNDAEFAKQISQLGNLYINEAFSNSHRKAASMVGITKYLPYYAGFHLAAEVEALEKIKKSGNKPVIAIIGGAKAGDKLPVIKKLLPRVNAVLTGGVVANTFLSAKGYKIGKSLVDKEVLKEARALLRQAGKKILLPTDVILDKVSTKKSEALWRGVKEVKNNERIVDIGTRTVQAYSQQIKAAQTIFWGGTLGLAEQHEWSHGSLALARLVSARARRYAFVVVGGGDTNAFFHMHKLLVDHFCSAGGAMLEFLGGVKLPALEAIKVKQK